MNAKSDADRFGVALTRLFASRGGRVPSVIDGEVYFETLEHLSIEQVEEVMAQATREKGDFVPSAGDLEAAASKLPAAPYHQAFLPAWERKWVDPPPAEELKALRARMPRGPMTGGKEGNS